MVGRDGSTFTPLAYVECEESDTQVRPYLRGCVGGLVNGAATTTHSLCVCVGGAGGEVWEDVEFRVAER